TYEGPFVFGTANLLTGTNVLAVEVHQVNAGSSDIVMGAELIAEPLTGGTPTYTPGAANSIAAARPDFPAVWLNELQAYNTAGPADQFGDRDPWLELYNAGTNTIDLGTYFLTDSYTNLTRWPFPAGTLLGPGAFWIVWLDNEPGEQVNGELHANFRPALTNGTLALATLYNGSNTVMDYFNWSYSSPNRSVGSIPDGNPCQRHSLAIVTPGTTNNSTLPPVAVYVNEWLAQNSATLPDPVDGQFEDWIELYKSEHSPVDLGGYYLTDTLTDKTKWKIPDNTIISAQGFLLIWADNENSQNNETNSDRHANFQLAAGGEAIGLFTDTGVQVDAVVFGPQLNDVSEGRYPDGGPAIYAMTNRTPRAANFLGSMNEPPVLGAIGPRSAVEGQTFSFTASASDSNLADTLTFTLDAGAPAGAAITAGGLFTWAPTEAQGGASYNLTVRVTDNGVPPLNDFETFSINVLKTNSAPVLNVINNPTVVEKQLLAFTATATDVDQPAQHLIFSLDPGAPAGAAITTNGNFTWTPTEAQGTNQYPIVVRVTDDGEPVRSSFQVVVIFVAESNEPPVLAVITNRTAFPGDLVTFTNSATDPDVPTNTLSYSLGAGSPIDASIVPQTGVFSWPVPANQPVSTNAVTITVSDNGSPFLSNSRTFKIIVGASLRISSIVDAGGGSVTITAPAISGRNYTLVTKDELDATGGWPTTGTTQAATNTTVIFSVPATNAQRFYRIILEP
ncbi:MAG TPA: lamin tail domain-containing protein, partial [Vicinamibacterales bacterium]|nr:lamin tail domain-containing protein [Vicinamibacterales bacterium]